jgi:signal transduction histidine kinase
VSDAVFEGLHAKERGGGRVVTRLLRHLLTSLRADCAYVYTLAKDRATLTPAFFVCRSPRNAAALRPSPGVSAKERPSEENQPPFLALLDEPWLLDRLLKGEVLIVDPPNSRELGAVEGAVRQRARILVPMMRGGGSSGSDKRRQPPGGRSDSPHPGVSRHREEKQAGASRSEEKLRPGGDAGRRRRAGKRQRGIVGVMAIEGGPAVLSAMERDLLRTVGAMLAALLAARRSRRALKADNRTLLRHMRSLPREAESHRLVAEGLRDILVVLNSDRNLHGILDYLVTQGRALLGANACVLYRWDRDQPSIVIEARTGLPESFPALGELPLDSGELPEVQSLRGPILSPVPVVEPDFARRDMQGTADVAMTGAPVQAWMGALAGHYRAQLSVPLVVKSTYYGNLGLYYRAPRSFSNRDISLALSFASQAALAIENAQLRLQAEHAAVLQERSRLARDLHDSVTQSLYSLTLLAEAGRRLAMAGDLPQVKGAITRLGEIGQQALKEMRLLVYELRPLVLRREGLLRALSLRMETVERRAGVDARLIVEGEPALSPLLEEQLYHLIQEALNNALKHAGATVVTVRFARTGERLQLEVIDNGKGFDPGQPGREGGMGLVNMRERAERLGGAFLVESQEGQGTRISVGLELPAYRPGAREPGQRATSDPGVSSSG